MLIQEGSKYSVSNLVKIRLSRTLEIDLINGKKWILVRPVGRST